MDWQRSSDVEMPSQKAGAAAQRQSTIDSSAQGDDSRTRRTAGQDSTSQRHANLARPSSGQPKDDTRRQQATLPPFTGHPYGQAGPSGSGQQQSRGSAAAESQAGVSARLPSNRPGPPTRPPAFSSLPGPPPRPPTSATPVPQVWSSPCSML